MQLAADVKRDCNASHAHLRCSNQHYNRCWGPYAASLTMSFRFCALHLVAQVVDGQYAARCLVDAIRPVLGCQVDRHQRRVPVIGNEDALLTIQAALQGELLRVKGTAETSEVRVGVGGRVESGSV